MRKTQDTEKAHVLELKWLEDFVCVAEMGHFARAAEVRRITQSAISRRIQSLELWVGAELFDRARHPIELTDAGKEFIKFARDIIASSYSGRAYVGDLERPHQDNITVACLHTLSLSLVPKLVTDLGKVLPSFTTSIVAETRSIEEYLYGLYNGACDFFVCFHHDGIAMGIDPKEFPFLSLGAQSVSAYVNSVITDFDFDAEDRIPYIGYSPNTYMAKVVEHTVKSARFRNKLDLVYQASLAESVKTATQLGLGVSWLPELVLGPSLETHSLKPVLKQHSTALDVRIYRSAHSDNPLVPKIWDVISSRESFRSGIANS